MCSQIKSEYCPSTVPSPGDSIADILEERGITTSAFANSIGYPIDVVAGIISGDAPINKGIALQLERVLGPPANAWLRHEAEYRECLARSDRSSLFDANTALITNMCGNPGKMGMDAVCVGNEPH